MWLLKRFLFYYIRAFLLGIIRVVVTIFVMFMLIQGPLLLKNLWSRLPCPALHYEWFGDSAIKTTVGAEIGKSVLCKLFFLLGRSVWVFLLLGILYIGLAIFFVHYSWLSKQKYRAERFSTYIIFCTLGYLRTVILLFCALTFITNDPYDTGFLGTGLYRLGERVPGFLVLRIWLGVWFGVIAFTRIIPISWLVRRSSFLGRSTGISSIISIMGKVLKKSRFLLGYCQTMFVYRWSLAEKSNFIAERYLLTGLVEASTRVLTGDEK